VPPDYDVFLYPNDFPALSMEAPPYEPYVSSAGLFATTGARGACDVVLYSPNHTAPPSSLTLQNWRKIVDLWTSRSFELLSLGDVSTVAVFENCGEAIGVTMPHPHGQIYAMPFIPPIIRMELQSSAQYANAHHGSCVFCDLLAGEVEQRDRIIFQNHSFVCFVPFAARFPSEVSVYARRHFGVLTDLTEPERSDLAEAISVCRRKLDNLYGFLMPLMMAVKQTPRSIPADPVQPPYHFHVQMLPVQRSATKLKYLATIETAFGTFLADTQPEERAEALRQAEPKTTRN
jgi:UDPglucose--hexose-1-phosphate uridylyltransferase